MEKFTSRFLTRCALAGFVSLGAAQVVDAAPLFTEDFSDNSAGWVLGTEWQIGPAAVSPPAAGNGDPALDHSSSGDNGVAGVNIGGNASTALHPFYYMTSPVINLGSVSGVVNFEFYRWLNSDYPPFMNSTIDVFNGSVWTTIFSVPGGSIIADNSWNLIAYDITAYANSNFQFRFGHTVTSGGVFTIGSWNIDDVAISDQSITSAVPIPAALPLLVSGLAGLGFAARRRKRNIGNG